MLVKNTHSRKATFDKINFSLYFNVIEKVQVRSNDSSCFSSFLASNRLLMANIIYTHILYTYIHYNMCIFIHRTTVYIKYIFHI